MDLRIEWMATKMEHRDVHNYHLYLQAINGLFLPFEPVRRYWDNFPSFEQFLRRYISSRMVVKRKRDWYYLLD